MAAAFTYRDRWRELRPSSPLWRNGAFLRAAVHRSQQAGGADELWTVPRTLSTGPFRGDRRRQLLELRPRDRTLEGELRMQLRRPWRLEPGMARSPAGKPRLAAGHAGRPF